MSKDKTLKHGQGTQLSKKKSRPAEDSDSSDNGVAKVMVPLVEEEGEPVKKVKKVKAPKVVEAENGSDGAPKKQGKKRTKRADPDEGGEKEKVAKKKSKSNASLENFPISEETRNKLRGRGISTLFPIQALTLEKILGGCDLVGRARTGMGKTLAFVLPVVERLLQLKHREERGVPPAVLVLAPTRELAKQVAEEFEATAPPSIRNVCIYGGAPYRPQEEALRRGVSVVVGTPGRVLDHIERGTLRVHGLKFFILDEADQMLDMGFKDDIQKVCDGMSKQDAQERQMLLFSATLPAWVHKVAKAHMRAGKIESVDLVEGEDQKASVDVRHIAIPCHWSSMPSTVNDVLSVYGAGKARTIVFCETKKECNELVVNSAIKSECQALHGDIPQKQREITLEAFRDGRLMVLVATDVAARGLDMMVDLVIQTKPPVTASGRTDVEAYVHRSGRTGRAGRKGICVTFFSPRYRVHVKEIEAAVGNKFEWAGAPQPKDIVAASAEGLLERIEDVDNKVFPLFASAAKRLLAEMSAEDAVCAAMALLTGHTKPLRSRSLLSNSDDFVTCQFTADQPIQHSGYVWTALRRVLSTAVTEDIRGMTMTADELGAVFDVPAKHMEEIEKAIVDNEWLSVCDALPELKENPNAQAAVRSGGGGYGFGRGNGGGFRRGGGGGGGGYGGRRGGFNGRGSGSFRGRRW